MKKIGILTWHYYSNFGSSLQAFALQHTLTKLGTDVVIVNYHSPKFGLYNKKKNILALILLFIDRLTFHKLNSSLCKLYGGINVASFQHKWQKTTRITQTNEGIKNITKHFDCIVYGSDQIWAPNVYNSIYMGAFVPQHVRKISYAASIGLNDIPDDMVKTYKQNLSSFHAVSVREQEGKDLLKRRCGIESTVVLDPTLMVDVEVYLKMQRPVNGIEGKYIFCYFLNKEHLYRTKVELYAKTRNLQIVGVSDKSSDASWMKCLTYIGADQFLWLINHAETVFTDSYHGSIFSLLFHKNLWTFVRFDEDNPICQNSRIRQLQNNFNIAHRIINSSSEIDDSKCIDYDLFEIRLAQLRESSLAFLRNVL